jgi:Protein of unknown function (DUF732)
MVGQCPICQRTVQLRKSGLVAAHRARGEKCSGAGESPVGGSVSARARANKAQIPLQATSIQLSKASLNGPTGTCPGCLKVVPLESGSGLVASHGSKRCAGTGKRPIRAVEGPSGTKRMSWQSRFTLVGGLVLLVVWGVQSCSGSNDRQTSPTSAEEVDANDGSTRTALPTRATPRPTTAPPVASTAVPSAVVDEVFIARLDEYGVEYSSRQEAIGYGLMVCMEIDLGGTPLEISSTLTSQAGWPAAVAGAIVGSAVAAYCPQHGHLL